MTKLEQEVRQFLYTAKVKSFEDVLRMVLKHKGVRSMVLGHASEEVLYNYLKSLPYLTEVVCPLYRQGDFKVWYRGEPYLIEAKSIQKKSVRYYDDGTWSGWARYAHAGLCWQPLPTGEDVLTSAYPADRCDIGAINLYNATKRHEFVFVRESDLPRMQSQHNKQYRKDQVNLLTAGRVNIDSNLGPPFTRDLKELLERLHQERMMEKQQQYSQQQESPSLSMCSLN
jgi:hypothetical protein